MLKILLVRKSSRQQLAYIIPVQLRMVKIQQIDKIIA